MLDIPVTVIDFDLVTGRQLSLDISFAKYPCNGYQLRFGLLKPSGRRRYNFLSFDEKCSLFESSSAFFLSSHVRQNSEDKRKKRRPRSGRRDYVAIRDVLTTLSTMGRPFRRGGRGAFFMFFNIFGRLSYMLKLLSALCGIIFLLFQLLSLANDH